jgi:hypothetical protein
MAERVEESDAEPIIRLDKLASVGPPMAEVARPIGLLQRAIAGIGSPSGVDNLPSGEVGRVRLFNAVLIVNVVLIVASLICSGVAVALAIGPRRRGTPPTSTYVSAAIIAGVSIEKCALTTFPSLIVQMWISGRSNGFPVATTCPAVLPY